MESLGNNLDTLNVQANLFECIPNQIEEDNILVSDINLAGALPYTYQNGKGEEVEVKIQSFLKKGGEFLETRIKGKQVGSIQNDVLMLWQTMYWEQLESQENVTREDKDKIVIYYNIATLTERMGYKAGSRRMIMDAIKELQELKYEMSNFGYVEVKESGEKQIGFKKQRMNLVTRHGEVKGISTVKGKVSSKGSFFVELDATLLANISAGMVAKVNTSEYFSLKTGPQRRLLPQLEAKRKLMGPKFTVKLTEIANVLGFHYPPKQHERVRGAFKRVKETLGNIDFEIIKRHGEHEWDIYVEFFDARIEDKTLSPEAAFYNLLVQDYGEQALDQIDFRSRDVQIIKGQIQKQMGQEDAPYDFEGEECLLYQFLIDLALFQVIKEKYTLTSKFSNFVLHLLNASKKGMLGIPGGYRHFVKFRIEEEKKIRIKKEVELARVQEERDEKLKIQVKMDAFDKNFDAFMKEKEIRDNLYEKAKTRFLQNDPRLKRSDLEDPTMAKMYSLQIDQWVKKIAQEEWLSGTLMDNLGIK